MQPTLGAGLGIGKNCAQTQTQNFLHARMFARNIGIEPVYQPQPFPNSLPQTFSHSRQSMQLAAFKT